MLGANLSLKSSVSGFGLLAAAMLLLAGCVSEPNSNDSQLDDGLEQALVLRVIDGDTVELEDGRVVRYLGIDTPETVHPEKPIECYGPESTERNRELVEGKVVDLQSDVIDKDSYGRLLRYVFEGGTFVNGVLVWEGYAYAKSYGEELRLYQTLVQLQRSSEELGAGLWSQCPRG